MLSSWEDMLFLFLLPLPHSHTHTHTRTHTHTLTHASSLALQHNIGLGGAVVVALYAKAHPTAASSASPSLAHAAAAGGAAGGVADIPARELEHEFAFLASSAADRSSKKGARRPKEGTALSKQALPRPPASFSADTVNNAFREAVSKAKDVILETNGTISVIHRSLA